VGGNILEIIGPEIDAKRETPCRYGPMKLIHPNRYHLKEIPMIRRLLIVLVLSAPLFASPAPSQVKKVTFDSQAAFEYLKALASDAMLGRKSGEPGGRLAEEYVAGKFKEWGLEPAGPKASYYQDMTYVYYAVERGATLDIVAHNKKREFVFGEDWRQQPFSGSGTLGADIVFVGYGLSAPQKGYDDYSGVDVKDKLVLFSTDTPRRFEVTLREEAALSNRIKTAKAHGARGVLTFRSATQATGGSVGRVLEKDVYRPDFLIISLESKILDFIFKWQRADPRFFFQQIEATGKPQSYELDVQSLINLKVVFDEKRPTRNVLAKITGTDENLKNEFVIVGAHMDHLGIDMAGDVFNGADDNASGTAVVLETARVLKLNKFKPKRTIIFALWAAEEEGLLGSKYYADNPVYPLEKTVANINLDMEGHGTGKVNAGGIYYAPEVWEILKARLPKDLLGNVIAGRGGPGGSDHTAFLINGVPAFMVNTAGSHFKTNRVGDVIDLIKPDILKNSGLFVTAVLEVLATELKVPILPRRKETFFWRFGTIINHEIPALDEFISKRPDGWDPDVDIQLAVVGEKAGLSGDALRVDMLKALWAAKETLAHSEGMTAYAYGGPGPTGGNMTGPWGPAKTTVVAGLNGLASIRDELRWAEVFSNQGVNFVRIDQPSFLFDDKGLNVEGKKVLDAIGKANLLLIAGGLDPVQAKALLENTQKPVLLEMISLPDKDILNLIKKTESALGLILGKGEDAASFFKKIAEARTALGVDYFTIANENCLWQPAGKDQMLNVIAEALKAQYPVEELVDLFSGAFLRVLNLARKGG
jgi:Peptidase family M28